MSSVSQHSVAPFASLPRADAPRQGFLQIFLSPFRDVDDRVVRLAAAAKSERQARRLAMSAAPEPRGA